MQTALLCYIKPLDNRMFTADDILRPTLSVKPLPILTINKILRNFGLNHFIIFSFSKQAFNES